MKFITVTSTNLMSEYENVFKLHPAIEESEVKCFNLFNNKLRTFQQLKFYIHILGFWKCNLPVNKIKWIFE